MTTRKRLPGINPVRVPADDDSIRFLRSTTVTTIHRESEGDTDASVIHTARFAIKPGTIPDQKNDYGMWRFRPSRLEAEYRNGFLEAVGVTGARVIKAGLSETQEASCRWRRPFRRPELDRDELPDPIARALAYYELAVAVETGDKK